MEACRAPVHASTSSPGLKAFLTACLFGALVFLVYSNSLNCSWQFDDITNIQNNKYLQIEDLSLQSLKRTLVADPGRPGAVYRPVACFTFGLNHYFGGLHVLGYRLVNIVIHVLCSIVLFLFLHHTLNSFSFGGRYASRSHFIALMAALMWALHPIQVQSVTYIVQRMSSLAGLFYVLSLYLYAKGRTGRTKAVKTVLLILCAVSFVLAFGAKENAVLLPVSLVLYEVVIVKKGNFAALLPRMGRIIVILAGVALLTVLYLHHWREGVFSFLQGYEDRPFSISERLLTEPRVVLFYVSLLIYPMPHRFSVAHSFEVSKSVVDPPSTLLAIVAIAGSVLFLILRARKNPLISFSFLFFLLNHLVESTIIPLELIFEHRNYIPSMMFFLPFALWLKALLDVRIHSWEIKPFAKGLIVFVVLLLGYSTYLRNFVWENPGTLWTDALQKAPDNLRVHHNLGLYYHETGLKQEALFHYLQALKSPVINRRDEPVGAYYQLGKLYGEMGDYKKAKWAYNQALSMKPDLACALVDLASIYDKEGDRTKANEYLAKALKIGPNDPTVKLNVGLYYLGAWNPEAAIHHLVGALKEKKVESKSLTYLGIASEQRGQYEVSEIQFRNSLALNPKNVTPHLHLAQIYMRTGREAEAGMEVETIITLLALDKNLFDLVMGLIVKEGNRGDVYLSKDLLLPLFLRSLENGSHPEMREEIKKIMEKRTEIR